MKKVKGILSVLMLLFFTQFQTANALDVENDYVVKIDQVFTYNSLSNGDVLLYSRLLTLMVKT